MRIGLVVAMVFLAGCTNDAQSSPDDDADEQTAPEVAPQVLFDGQQAWPTTPGTTTAMAFDAPGNATKIVLHFNWRGQYPVGTSSFRAAVAILPSGEEVELLGGDLPANPYVCTTTVCGPANDRDFTFEGDVAGAWAVELRGVYTATATLRAEAFVA